MGEQRKSLPRFRREGAAEAIGLTEDDLAILRHVQRHRFLRSDDIYRLFPARSHDRLSRRLTALYRGKYLDRPSAQIDYHRTGGSKSYVYGLDNAGARLLRRKAGLPPDSSDWRERNRNYTRESLDHTLAISQFMVDVEIACRAHPNVAFIPFDDMLVGSPEATRRSRTPMAWPVPVQWSSGRAAIRVVPDAIFGLSVDFADQGPKKSYVFLEIDRGTMTIVPSERVRDSEAFLYRTTMLRKFLSYAESWRQKMHRQRFNIPAARVLTVTTSQARAEAMRQAAYDLVVRPLALPAGLFLFGLRAVSNDALTTAFLDAAGNKVHLIPSG